MDIEKLKERQEHGRKIAIWGAGKNGYTFYKIFQKLNISIDFFIDNNEQKWEQKVTGEILCHAPSWLAGEEPFIVYICVPPDLYEIIYNQAKRLACIELRDIDEILDDLIANYQEEYLELLEELPYVESGEIFYRTGKAGNLKPENYVSLYKSKRHAADKIAVYTSVFGGYDQVLEPTYIADHLDYYYISDEKPENLKVYQWIDAHKCIPTDIVNPIKRNRYVKMHPHKIFPQYKYSIYIDGNVKVVADISEFISTSKLGMSAFMHPIRDDIYYEALTIKNAQRVSAYDVCRQMKKYMSEGMPFRYGLVEMGIMAREHNKKACIEVMEKWWEEFDSMARRDQFSFMYAMWKNNRSIDDLMILGNNRKHCPLIEIYEHKN